MFWISFLLKKKIEILLIPCLSLYTYTQTTNMNCSYCGRNEKECEEQTELERNPITEWYVWGISCDECYYCHHPDCDDCYYTNHPEPEKFKVKKTKRPVELVIVDMLLKKNNAYINKESYNEYIKKNAPKKLNKIINKYDDEDIIECYTIGLPNSHPCYYDVLFVFPVEVDTIPVVIQNINTSSCFAMWNSNIYCDEENPEDTNDVELIELVGKGWRKGLKKVLNDEYINKKPPVSIDDIFKSLKLIKSIKEGEKEVKGVCFECGKEGKFIGEEGDDWLCIDCS